MKTRLSSLVIALCLVLSMAVTAFAAPLTDIENHWAKEQIKTWEEKGLVKGYEDGTFRPDNNVSRAEFMALVNRAFNYQEKAEIDYKDVKEDAWYADVIKIAKAAGYISGYEDGTMRPNNPISRQEAATIIMKILGLEENAAGANRFQDASSIPAWSKGAVGAVASAGIMGGYPDGTFRAASFITRAEAVVTLDRALSGEAGVVKEDVIYDKAGTYGPETGTEVINRNVIITAAGVTLQNTVIEGNLTIDKAVGNGDVYLKKVTVKGDTYIYGGGKDSIYFIDSQTGKVYVLKDDGPVRIVVTKTTVIEEIIAQSEVIIEEVDLTGEGVKGITVDKKVDGTIEINLKGVNLEELEINTPGVIVRTDRNTTINHLTVNAKTDFRGQGTISNAVINADGVTFEKMPEKQEVNKGVTPPTVAKSGGGGGGGGSSKEEVSAISVEGEAVVGATLTAKVTPDKATVNYQWQRSGAEDGEYVDIEEATDSTYKLTDEDEGKWIRVKVTGTGNYTGTKISDPVGPVTVALKEVVRADGDVTQDPGNTGGTDLSYSFDADSSTLTIDADGATLPYYVQDGTTPPRGANWVGVAIPIPDGVNTEEVTATINDAACEDLFFAEGKYMEYIDVKDGDLSAGTATYTWVIKWGSGYADETITVKLINVGGLEGAPLKVVSRVDDEVTQDPGNTGGTDLSYSFDADSSTLTIDADGATLPYYVQDGTTPPRGANWVGVAIPIPDGVNTEEVTATINDAACEDLFFAEGKYMEYIDVKDGDLSAGTATYTWVIKWGSGYADETITVKLINVGGLEGAPLKVVSRVDDEVTQDPGNTGGTDLSYSFDADSSTLTIDADGATLPYYVQDGTTPPRGANWVGVAIPIPDGVNTEEVTATINDAACEDLFFAEGKYMEYIDVKDGDLSAGTATYTWVIKWGSGYADETITVKLINVGGLEGAPLKVVSRVDDEVTQDPGNTGGTDLSYSFDADSSTLTIDADGATLPYYVQDGTTPPRGANWVGVAIPIPDGVNTEEVTATINDAACEDLFFAEGKYMEYIDVKDGDLSAGTATYTWVIKWGSGYADETITVKLINVGGLEGAPLKVVSRVDDEVTQDPGNTGGTDLSYSFDADSSTLTIDADGATLPYYVQDGTTPPRGANWVGVAIPIPDGVNTEEVTATINDAACEDLFFAEGKYMEYIDVKDGDLSAGTATYTWVIKWGSGYADETITVKLINVGGLEGAPLKVVSRVDDEVTQDPGNTGGTDLSYSFDADSSTLTIDADGATLPYYVQDGTTPPRGANWVGVAIPIPDGVNTEEVTATINDAACEDLFFAEGKYMEYIDVKDGDLSAGTATYTWVIKWGSGYADETITVKLINVGGLEGAPLKVVSRVDDEVTQDPGNTGGTDLSYSFDADSSTLTIDADGATLPYYVQDGTTPPRGANWVGVAIPIPDGVNTEEVTATINDAACEDLFFAEGKYMEYIDVKDGDLSAGTATYTWVIKWGSGYADETITVKLINVGGLEGAPLKVVSRVDDEVTQDPGNTGGTDLSYSFDADSSTLTIDADGATLPYYVQDGTTPPRGANWVGVAIPIPDGVNTEEVTATINDAACEDLFFAEGKYMEYIDVKDGDLSAGTATYTWVIKWGSGYADETITVKLINVGGLEGAPLKVVSRVDDEVTQDPGNTGGTDLSYSFDADSSTLTIDADGATLPYYVQDGTTPPRGANWVGVAIPIPDGVNTEEVTATINDAACEDLFFAEGKYMEYIDVKDGDLSAGTATYTWVIKWGSGYADETITVKLINVGGLEGAPLKVVSRVDDEVTQDPGNTGGTDLSYSFDADSSTLTIDADGATLPYYVQDGTTPPRGANWVGVAIPIPDGVNTEEVTATINDAACEDLFFAEGKYMEYIDVKDGDLSAGTATYTWVIKWGSGYADETITVKLINVGGLEGAPLKVVSRVDDEVTQDPGNTGGTDLSYSFDADSSTLTIDADGATLPYYVQDGTTPPRGANWVGVAIPIPDGVNTEEVTATINDAACEDLFFAEGKYMEYIDVKDGDLSAGTATYTWVIKWGSGYADETITVKLINVGGLEGAPLKVVSRVDDEVTQDPGNTGGTDLSYSFDADSSTLTIDADGATLPYYVQDGTTPPRGANWVGVAIPIPDGVNTEEVTATINDAACEDLFFAEGKYMEYIDVKADDLTEGAATYEWVIKWGSGYADETITINLVGVAGLEAPEEEPVEVVRADGDVTQDAGKTGGTELIYSFVAEGKVLTIDAKNTKLPYYEADGSTPPRTANWVGVAIPVPEGVNTEEVTATINGTECVDLFFADGKYMEYIDVKADDLTEGAATYEWVIKWGSGYADETITINLVGVAGLEAPEEEPVEVVRADGDVTQDAGKTGGTELIYSFVAEGKVLTIDAKNTKLPYYEADGSTPPRTANWVGVAIPVPEGVNTEEVTATINGTECVDLFFADGKYMEYIDVKADDLTEGAATYEWVIKWGSGYADETITINLVGVAGLEAPEEEPVEVVRADGDVTQDAGKTGGTELIYSFVAEGKVLTIDAKNTKLPYYEADGSTPPRTANWVGVAIPVPEGVNTEEVTATINGTECVDLFFADGKYMEYIDVKADDLTEGAATYEWVIKWGSGYADETITINLVGVAGLEAPEEEPVEVVRADGDVTQDAGKTGGTELIYSFVAEGKVLTIDAKNTKLPYYEADGSTPPRTANWVGVAIPVPEGVNTEEVTATINGTECVDLFFADGKYMEYIDVKADDLTEGAATYEWVIKWGSGYADETITINLVGVAGLEAPEEEPVEVVRADGDVTQDAGKTGGTELIYSFVAEGKVLTIDAKNTKLPYYEADGSTPPRTANWVGVAIPVPEGVNTEEVTATINGTECVDLFFADGKYMEYIDVKADDLTEGAATYEWVIKWGSGYADETITINLVGVAGLEAPEEEPVEVVRADGDVTQDAGKTGGTELIYSFVAEGKVLTIDAKNTKLPYYEADGSTPPRTANWVGVAIPVPEGVNTEEVTATINGTECVDLFFADGKYMEYIDVKADDLTEGAATYEWVIKWGSGYADETITIELINVAGLEAPEEEPVEVVRADGDVTQDAGKTGGTELIYSFVAEGKVLTIDAKNTKLPYYEADGSTPPRTANWVGVAIPVPEGVNTEEVTATINGTACVDLFFAEGKYMEYIDVKEVVDGKATFTWVIKWGSGYADETITIELINVAGLEAPEEEPEPATLVATGSYGIHDNKVYAGYELQDKDDTQIPLVESNIESISVKDPDGNVTELTVVGETDPYLWFNITKKAGTYTYTVVTKGEDAKTYEATIDWNEPTEATVSFQAPAGAEAVFTAASEDAPAQVDFSKVTADKLLDWTSVKDGYYAIELKIEGVDLSEDNVKYAFRVYGDGTAIEPEIKGDLDCQYVTTDWELGTATMYYVLADGSLYQAKINVVSLTPADEPAPEVSGSIERDPGNTGGDLQYNIENDTVTFTSGEIKWYPEDKDLGRAAGNRVGVQINAPADFDTTGVTVKIGEQTYNWDEIEDGDGYFWWYPLVTEAGQQFTATVVWNESSTQEFKVVIGEGVTLEPAPDTTDPELVGVSPEAGDIQLGYGETFKLEVTASDENLYELEVDHSFEGTLPEFSVYASEDDPYGGQEAAFKAQGVEVTYDADAQKWTIDFGPTVTQQIVAKGGITFYLVLVDEAGNKWGSMDPTTPENTFAYTVTQDEAPEVSGSIERDPGNTGGDLQYNIENDTVTFTSGEIKWYPEDKDLGRAAGNRVGVQINAPADFDTTGVTVKIGEQTYNWDEIEDGDGYFWWYPLVTADKKEYTATVVWNEASTQVFKVVIGSGVTLEAEPAIKGEFVSTGNVGIAPDTAGDAAGKIYAEYKLVAEGKDISLASGNVEYIKVKVDEGGWEDLTPNTDATLWFNVEKATGSYEFEVKTTDGKKYTAILNWDKEIKTATWEATGREGEHDGKTYVEYKLLDGEAKVSLKVGDVKLIAIKEGDKWVALEPNTDETLWFNKARETGSYEFFVVTSEGVMYRATLDWVKTKAAEVDYNAVWNGARGTWYIKVSVPGEDLDADSVQTIKVIREAGVDLAEPRALTPDTDKVLWFGVAKADGDLGYKGAGEYAYEVVRKDGSKYIFSFTYDPDAVQGVEIVTTQGELVPAADYPGYENWSAVFTAAGVDFGQITKDQAIAMGLPGKDYYGVAMYLMADGVQVDLSAGNVKRVVRTDPAGDMTEPIVSGDNKYQFVHDGWGGPGQYTIVYTLKDGRVIEAKINIVSFEFKVKEPKVITGLGVLARDADKISVSNVELVNGVYTVTATALVELPEIESGTGVVGKWFGLLIMPEGIDSITELQYKTAYTGEFRDLTDADIAESGGAEQLVWWLNGSAEFPQAIELKYKGEADDTAIKLSVNFEDPFVDISAAIAAIAAGDYQDLQVDDVYSETDTTAAVQAVVDGILANLGLEGVTAEVTRAAEGVFTVTVRKGDAEKTTTVEATFVGRAEICYTPPGDLSPLPTVGVKVKVDGEFITDYTIGFDGVYDAIKPDANGIAIVPQGFLSDLSRVRVAYQGRILSVVASLTPAPKVIFGLDVAARDADKISVSNVELVNGVYTVTATALVELPEIESGTGVVGKWFGLLIMPEGIDSITELQYKTAYTGEFRDLTDADIAESGGAEQLVWWLNGSAEFPQAIELKYKGEADDTAIKLSVNFEDPFVDISAAIAAIAAGDYQDLQVDDVYSETDTTAAVQAVVDGILANLGLEGVTAEVTRAAEGVFTVTVRKGDAEKTTTVEATFVGRAEICYTPPGDLSPLPTVGVKVKVDGEFITDYTIGFDGVYDAIKPDANGIAIVPQGFLSDLSRVRVAYQGRILSVVYGGSW